MVDQCRLRRFVRRVHRNDRVRRTQGLRGYRHRGLPAECARHPAGLRSFRRPGHATQNPTDHAFNATTGTVAWSVPDTASFAPTTVAGGMVFNGLALASKAVQVRDATTGSVLAQVPLNQFNWSGIATVGDAVVFGVGTTASAANSGVEVLTPAGTPPVVPDRS